MKKPIERSRLLRSLFFPHPAVVAVCVPAAAALVSMLSLEVAMLAAFSLGVLGGIVYFCKLYHARVC